MSKSTATTRGSANYTCVICSDSYVGELPTEIKILAIGNSFSEDGMEYLWNVLTDAGVEKVTLGRLHIGGSSLSDHWNNISANSASYYYHKNTSGSWSYSSAATVEDGLTDEEWDYITVQQVSHYSGYPDSYTDLPSILNYIDQNKTNENAEILWQMTWAYQQDYTGDGFSKYYGSDQLKMYEAITETVKDKVLTQELISGVIPAGTTIQNLRTSYLGDTLTRDGLHLSLAHGRYSAALTWMTAITGISPDKVDWVPEAYPELAEDKAMIDEAVNYAVTAPYEIKQSSYTTAP